MDRKKLIDALVELNRSSTFQFTREWLHRQRTGRLRSLVLAAARQNQILEWLDQGGVPRAGSPSAAPADSSPAPASSAGATPPPAHAARKAGVVALDGTA